MNKAKRIMIALMASALVTAIVAAGALRRVDKWVQDALFQRPGVTSRDIVIIGIDEEALAQLGPYNTWDRNIMAAALEALGADPENLPAVVGIDVLYAGQTNAEADARLARAADALPNVVTASMAEFGDSVTWTDGRATALDTAAIVGYEQPFEALRACTVQGHINAMCDLDGVLRHALLYVEPEGRRVYSMASQIARLFQEGRGQTLREPSTNAAGHFYVPFYGKPGDFYDGVSIAWLIDGKVPPGYWANKIVLIGPYAAALQDAYFTPVDKGRQMYGVEFQANVIQSLLEGNNKVEISDGLQLAALFMLCAVAMALFMRMKMGDGGALCLSLIVMGMGCSVVLYGLGWVTHPLWLPVGVLALYVVAMVQHYIRTARERQALALEKERIGAELALATRIQSNSLPKVFPPFPERREFDIYASMTPAKEVGGDLYDFFMIDDDHLALVIGDVSGKGVPAALFMMVAIALIHHVAISHLSPAKVLQIVNSEICARNPEEMFVTVWLGVLEISTGTLTAANAGHEFPALKRSDGHFELLKDRHGFVIGGMDGMRYREYAIPLAPGDKLFVYTDGVPEATDASETMFGVERMVEALQSGEDGSPEAVLDGVSLAVQAFVGSAPQFDDLTMLCLQYNGPAPAPEGEGAADVAAAAL